MKSIHRTIGVLMFCSATTFVLSACAEEETCGPTPTSPLLVTVACHEGAFDSADNLGSHELIVEQQGADGEWEDCERAYPAASPEDVHLCSTSSTVYAVEFECPGGDFDYAVRASQGNRRAYTLEPPGHLKLSCIGPPSHTLLLQELL